GSLFLSTLPVRGATMQSSLKGALDYLFLSTLPVRGATTMVWTPLHSVLLLFLSTLPVRGATCTGTQERGEQRISIHAPREGSDRSPQTPECGPGYFYPRSP